MGEKGHDLDPKKLGHILDEVLPPTIFVVENTPHIFPLIEHRWASAKFPYTVRFFPSAKSVLEAYDTIQGSTVVLVILDLAIADMDGLQLLKSLKRMCYVPETVVLSHRGTLEESLEAMRLGARDYILRPISDEALVVHIAQLVERYDPADNLERYNHEVGMIKRHQQLEEYLLHRYVDDVPLDSREINMIMAYRDEGVEGDSQAAAEKAEKKPVVLVVDDEPYARLLLQTGLAAEFETEEAPSADAAVSILKADVQKRIALVVLDISMPGLKGDAAVAVIKKARPDVEVVMLTAYPITDKAVRSFRNGAFEYLNKPYDDGELIRTLHLAYARKRDRELFSIHDDGGGRLPFQRRLQIFKELILKNRILKRPVTFGDLTRFFPECQYLKWNTEEAMDMDVLTQDPETAIRQWAAESQRIFQGLLEKYKDAF